MLNSITVLILTFNEEANIGRTLAHLDWAQDVVVVDSFSTDSTVEIVKSFPNVRLFQRVFDRHDLQWTFGLHETGIRTDWVLGLDADWQLTDAFRRELAGLDPGDVCGFFVHFDFAVYGQKLRGALYPPVIALYRRDATRYIMHGHGQRAHVSGKLSELRARVTHDDHKTLAQWSRAQARYAELEARYLVATPWRELPLSHRLRRAYVVMPWLTPLVFLTARRGLLDGRAGALYALQRAIVELMIAAFMLARHFPGAPDARLDSSDERTVPMPPTPGTVHSAADSPPSLDPQARAGREP
ncbi:MAG: glycosyltransferase family 2 protein [Pseudomonadota bacterium]